MKKIYSCLLTCILLSNLSYGQPISGPEDINYQPVSDVYRLNLPVDIPITAVGAGWSLYAFSKIYSKDPSSDEDIRNLSRDNIPAFDRWAAGMHSENADKTSDYLFYGAMPLPLILLADKQIRHDAPKVGFLYLEAMAITGLLYTGSVYVTDRYRPETYRTDLPINDLKSGNLRNSFFAGHPALVATSTFFVAKVYNDYHPGSKAKWFLYGGAIAATGATVYLRHVAGKHFPSDLVIGTAIGTLSGLLVPELHKKSRMGDRAWMISPSMIGDATGLAFTYKF